MLCKTTKTFTHLTVSTSVESGYLADNPLSKPQSRLLAIGALLVERHVYSLGSSIEIFFSWYKETI